jgi:hypothetical protein
MGAPLPTPAPFVASVQAPRVLHPVTSVSTRWWRAPGLWVVILCALFAIYCALRISTAREFILGVLLLVSALAMHVYRTVH